MSEPDTNATIGLLRCMRALADEAANLQLTRTLAALQQAMETCRTEAVMSGRPSSTRLH